MPILLATCQTGVVAHVSQNRRSEPRRRPFEDLVMTQLHSISSNREAHLQSYV